jgi:hypothetical protein
MNFLSYYPIKLKHSSDFHVEFSGLQLEAKFDEMLEMLGVDKMLIQFFMKFINALVSRIVTLNDRR